MFQNNFQKMRYCNFWITIYCVRCSRSSADIEVKSSEVKVSVIFHVIVDPSGTLTVDAVLVPLAATERFEDNVV